MLCQTLNAPIADPLASNPLVFTNGKTWAIYASGADGDTRSIASFTPRNATRTYSASELLDALNRMQQQSANELAQRLQTETAKLGEIARKKDEAGVKQQYAAVGKVCGSCHESFRAK